MTAGLTMLQALNADSEIFDRLALKTERLHEGLEAVLKTTHIPYQINRVGSMISLHFTEKKVVDFETAASGNNEKFKNYFHGMLNEGIYLPPSAFESYFLNDALSFEDIDFTINAFKKVVNKI
jgi:glutamate-1-semialdehyde 2,1-aminomutase